MIDAEIYGLDVPILVSTGTGGGDVSLIVRPPAGCAYEMIGGYYYHDDGAAARVMVPYLDDGVSQWPLCKAKSAGHTSAEIVSVYAIDPGTNNVGIGWQRPIWLTPALYLSISFFGLGVGKKGSVRLIVRTLRGVV